MVFEKMETKVLHNFIQQGENETTEFKLSFQKEVIEFLKEIQKGFRVTVYKAFTATKDDEGINRLLSFIRTSPSLRVSQISKALDIPQKTLERWIKQLKDENKVEYRGSKKTGGYHAL